MKIIIFLLFFFSFTTIFSQESPPTESEVRSLIKESINKDYQSAEKARNKLLSMIESISIPMLFNILRKGEPCEQVETAVLIAEIDSKNKEIVPILAKLARGSNLLSFLDLEEEFMCRRKAAFYLALSADGIRELAKILKDGDIWEKQSAIFAFDDLTESTDYPEDISNAIKQAIPAIGALTSSEDEILANMSNEVLNQIINNKAPLELKELAKKYAAE